MNLISYILSQGTVNNSLLGDYGKQMCLTNFEVEMGNSWKA